MYTCTTCKKEYDGQPARIWGPHKQLINCAQCVKDQRDKSLRARQDRFKRLADSGLCSWCDEPLNEQNRSRPHGNERKNMCKDCDSTSTARIQFNKWVTAIGPDPNKDMLHNAFWTYLSGSHSHTKRKIRWEQQRWEKLAAQRSAITESAKQAGLIIDQIRHNQQLDNLFLKLDPSKLEKLLQLVEMLEDKE